MGIPKVGDILSFVPSAFVDAKDDKRIPYRLRGTVIHVNEEHRHFTLQANVWGHTFCESFKY